MPQKNVAIPSTYVSLSSLSLPLSRRALSFFPKAIEFLPPSLSLCAIPVRVLDNHRLGVVNSYFLMNVVKWPSRKREILPDGEAGDGFKMLHLSFMGFLCILMIFIVFRTTIYQYQQTEIEDRLHPFGNFKELPLVRLDSLPRGIIHPRADLELRSLWSSSSSKVNGLRNHSLLAMAVGISQKDNVNSIVKKFLPENFTIILFHYDGNVNGWSDFGWSKSTIHIVAQNQTKWWFAKRFLHPDVVNIYDYIFLWDEDLGVKNFHPGRYLDIVKSEELEISQPALDPLSTEIHHKITVRKRTHMIHRRMYSRRGPFKCSNSSRGPPCAGWVEVMAPVFSMASWRCAWNLIQNDLVHGWGLDIKIGYCAQGDRMHKVGIVDSEYVVHQGVQTLGGSSDIKASECKKSHKSRRSYDIRYAIRREATLELETFKERWEKAVKEDTKWVDPYLDWRDKFSKLKKHRWKRSTLP